MRSFVTLAMLVLVGPALYAQGALEILGSMTPNDGQYRNRIPNFTPPLDYTEVCVKDGVVASDQKLGGQPTPGGNCEPGDIGWLIEKNFRNGADWAEAKMACLIAGMRLPEPFEFKYSCLHAAELGLANMTGGGHWASNRATPVGQSGVEPNGLVAPSMGNIACASARAARVGTDVETEDIDIFRCAK